MAYTAPHVPALKQIAKKKHCIRVATEMHSVNATVKCFAEFYEQWLQPSYTDIDMHECMNASMRK